ncbi:MAG: hypothetical protein AAF264_10710, partial [Pseudomonadota bacterium]
MVRCDVAAQAMACAKGCRVAILRGEYGRRYREGHDPRQDVIVDRIGLGGDGRRERQDKRTDYEDTQNATEAARSGSGRTVKVARG